MPRTAVLSRSSPRAVLRASLLALCLAVVAPQGATAQDTQTLADIRQELSVLYVEVQRLKRELSTTGAPSANTGGGTPLDRINAIESELQRLTSKTENLEFRIGQVVEDGTNRIGDLEFRLCELEDGCDIGQLGETTSLGGAAAQGGGAGITAPVPSDTSELAVGEAADFEAAQTALSSGDYATAAGLLASFAETYPASPVAARAHLMRGEAHEGMGEMSMAARAYLDSFSGDPGGPVAPRALYKLGTSLGALGQRNEACVTLGEVGARFPQSDAAPDARTAMASLGCS